MSFRKIVQDQITLLNEGKPLAAFDRYFDDDGVMFDNDDLFGSGKVECRAKQAPFICSASDILGDITRCTFDAEKSTCVFRNQTTFVDEFGKRNQIDGLHWQRWEAGRVVEERYYRDEMMTEKITEGIFELGVAL